MKHAYLLVALLVSLASLPAAAQTISGGIVRPGTLPPSALASGGTTPSSTTYYRGDGTWQAVTGGYTLPIASSAVLGGVKIGSGIVEAGDGTISVTAASSGGFTPGTATIPSTLGLYVASYSGTSMYAYASAYWGTGTSVYGEGGGELRWQYSTDGGTTYVGIDGTSSTYFLTKGSQFWVPHPITSGSLYVRVLDVNAAGSVTSAVTASLAYVAPTTYTATAPITLTGNAFGLSLGTGLTTTGGALTRTTAGTAGTYAYPSSFTTNAYGDVTSVTAGTAPATYTGTAPIVVSGSAISASVMGASGASHAAGIVPDPGSTSGTSRYLREDGTWATVTSGSGISYLSTDPTSPSTGTVWYNNTVHKMKVKEASAVYAAVFSPDIGKPANGSVVDTSASISSGLILSYPLNEASGSTFTDRSATNDTGTVYSNSGSATTTGWSTDSTYTTALTFNTSSVGYAANTHNSATNIETLTVALAFKTTGSSFQVIYYQGQNTTTSAVFSAQVYISGGTVGFECFDSTSNSFVTSSASTYADGNWHTVIATRTRHGALTLNVDSATQVTGTDGTTSTTSATSLTTLAARPNTGTGPAAVTGSPLTGSLAYLNVWNVVLTSAQITAIQSDPFAMYR